MKERVVLSVAGDGVVSRLGSLLLGGLLGVGVVRELEDRGSSVRPGAGVWLGGTELLLADPPGVPLLVLLPRGRNGGEVDEARLVLRSSDVFKSFCYVQNCRLKAVVNCVKLNFFVSLFLTVSR